MKKEALHRYEGAEDGSILVMYLNEQPPGNACEELVRLNRELISAPDLAELLNAPSYLDTETKIRRRITELFNNFAKRITTVPTLYGVTAERWDLDWTLSTKDYAPENAAFVALLRLARKGLLDRVRTCKQCGRWLFARYAHQNYCSGTSCKEKAHHGTEKWKDARKKYVRRKRTEKLQKKGKGRP